MAEAEWVVQVQAPVDMPIEFQQKNQDWAIFPVVLILFLCFTQDERYQFRMEDRLRWVSSGRRGPRDQALQPYWADA